ncbi:MAG: cyclic nucleotide-binding domain-containing protein [Treponema sp.]|jgi:CRP-like cAMP-binding protein|nr:cyclic nucleotide-binding domain-containing protein [Treponema sp.]
MDDNGAINGIPLQQGIFIAPKTLQKYSLFGGLSSEQIENMLPYMEYKTFQEGEIIMSEGVYNDRVYFILEGRVEVGKNNVALAELREGDAFGEMELIEIVPIVATIRALDKVATISLSNRKLHEIYKNDISTFAMVIMNLARELSRRLKRMDTMAADGNAE